MIPLCRPPMPTPQISESLTIVAHGLGILMPWNVNLFVVFVHSPNYDGRYIYVTSDLYLCIYHISQLDNIGTLLSLFTSWHLTLQGLLNVLRI